MIDNNTILTILLSTLGFLLTGCLTLLCVFLRGIYGEMKGLNDKLLTVVNNQEWHYSAILQLQTRVSNLENK